jgi:ribonuclease HI
MRNRYRAVCYKCKKIVEPGKGYFERKNGGWRVQCAEHAKKNKINAEINKNMEENKGSIEVHFDGAAHLWRKCAYGFTIEKDGKRIGDGHGKVPVHAFQATCNVAEHYALLQALEWLEKNGHKDDKIIVFGDSKMVINQIFGSWKCKHQNAPYYPFFLENIKMKKIFSEITGKHIPREWNSATDDLSKLGLRY